jgi:alkylhydroperoxidase family enzyme
LTAIWAIDDGARMWRERRAEDRLVRLRDDARGVVARVLDGDGVTAVEARRAAFAGPVEDPVLARYLDLVRGAPDRVSDASIERLHGAGFDDDAIFELTVAAALGAGMERLRLGLSLLGREP